MENQVRAMWSVALSDKECLKLARGVSPLLIRPDALTEYYHRPEAEPVE